MFKQAKLIYNFTLILKPTSRSIKSNDDDAVLLVSPKIRTKKSKEDNFIWLKLMQYV